MEISFNLPINGVSFGQVSIGLLRESFKRGESPSLFPIGEVDYSSQSNISKEFEDWIKACIDKGKKSHSRDIPCLKLWHLNGGIESVSNRHNLLTFYELDSPTEAELNVARNSNLIVTSSYTRDVFIKAGVDCEFAPLGFDEYNFYKTEPKNFDQERITFNVVGKFEKRKKHESIITSWLKKFGNNKKYFLQCAINNPFFSDSDNEKIWNSLGRKSGFFNISYLGSMPKNETYNQFLNSGDVVIGMSGAEGWGLPEFQSVCMGKHSVILNATSYKDWANESNSVLVEPSGKVDAYDEIFFKKGSDYNQGQIYDFNEDEFISACEDVIKRVENNRLNVEGEKLKDTFSISNSYDSILNSIK
tara:strand:- start:5091 stop:6170 length:1080 start_codon:yes stop_codon:yes gene_type:complete